MKTKKIFIVDDDIDVLETLVLQVQSFTELGPLDITKEENCELALETLKNTQFDFIITDFLMPNIDGLQLIKELRTENSLNKNTPVLCLSAYMPLIATHDLKSITSVKFLEKPHDAEDLLHALISSFASESVP